MITIKDVLDSIRHEIKVIKHLASKIKPEHLDYRPHPKQRSVLELLQYISHAGITSTEYIKNGNWNHGRQNAENAAKVNLSNFAQMMDQQMSKIEKVVNDAGEAKLAETRITLPSGATVTGDVALMNLPFRFLSAYRMQLFLYLKGCGLHELSTPNCWNGVEPQTPH